MSRHKSGCGCGQNNPSSKKGCRPCGFKPTANGQFKFSGTTRVLAEQSSVTSYLADPGSNGAAEAAAQLYPLALTQEITTLSVNVLYPIVQGQKCDVEVLRNGVSLPTPLKVTYLEGESGLKFAEISGETFNGASNPSSSKLDVVTTNSLVLVGPTTIAPVRLTAVVG